MAILFNCNLRFNCKTRGVVPLNLLLLQLPQIFKTLFKAMLSSKKWGRERERGNQWRAFKTASQWREIAMHLTYRRCSTIFNDNWRRIDESFTENISTILRWIAVGQALPRIAGNRILLYAIGYVWINYPAAYGI